jgi:hypothetical protein
MADLFNLDNYFVLLSEDNFNNLKIINITLSSISIIGSGFVFFIYWFFKEIRSFPLELVVWLCFSNAMCNLSVYVNMETKPIEVSPSCVLQGFIQMTFDNSAMIWASIIGFTAYKTVIDYEYIQRNIKRIRIKYLFLGFFLPMALSCAAYICEVFGPSGAWCWLDINTTDENKRKKVLVFVWIAYSVPWFFIFANAYFIIKAIIILKRNHLSGQEKLIVDKFSKKLRTYPIVMAICILPATINRIYSVFADKENLIMFYFQTIGDSLQGFLFAIIFGINPAIKEAVKELCFSLFRRQSRSYRSERSNYDNDMNNNNNNFESFISSDELQAKKKLKKISNGGHI